VYFSPDIIRMNKSRGLGEEIVRTSSTHERDIVCIQSIWLDYLHGRDLLGDRSVHWKIKTDSEVEVGKALTGFNSG
jgi:hypothetical protein